MSKRNLGNPNTKIPDDPIWIEFPRSDGNKNTWPSNTERVEDSAGHINWMKALDIDHPVALKWRIMVGNALALDLRKTPMEKGVLKDWPANYRMYDHHKGPANGNVRHDIYLYGPSQRRFRSPKEFLAHALWLFHDPTMDTKNCLCKYCLKVPQKIISGAFDSLMQAPQGPGFASPLSHAPSNDNAAGPSTQEDTPGRDMYSVLQKQGWARQNRDRDSASVARRRAHREQRARQKGKGKLQADGSAIPKVFAAVQKKLNPVVSLQTSENVLDMPMLAQRNRDLRAVYSRSANDKMGVMSWDQDDETAMMDLGVLSGTEPLALVNQENPPLRRWFRQSEVVWVQLPGEGIRLAPPGEQQPLNITTWPGIINESKVKNYPIPIHLTNIAKDSGPNGSFQSHQPQGKPLDSVSVNEETPLNGSSHTSSSGPPSHTTLQPPQSQRVSSAPQLFPTQSSSSSTLSSHPAAPTSTYVPLPSPASHLSSSSSASTSDHSAFHGISPATANVVQPAVSTRVQHPSAVTSTSDSSNSDSASWIVQESTVYSVRLLGSDLKVDVPDRDVLPYLAHAPAQELIDFLRDSPPEHFDFDREKIGQYDPFAASMRGKDEDHIESTELLHAGASAFALSVQIAATLCGYWSLTDKWEFQYVPPGHETRNVRVNLVTRNTIGDGQSIDSASTAPAPAPGPSMATPMTAPRTTLSTTTVTGGLSLQHAIEAAGKANALGIPSTPSNKTNLNALSNTGPFYNEVSGTSNAMDETEVRQAAVSALGVGMNGANGDGVAGVSSISAAETRQQRTPGAQTQIRFQGMWWGSERIWDGDFVRLKIGRAALAPDGAPNVYKASGWGKRNLEDWAKTEKLREEMLSAYTDGKGKGRDVFPPYLPETPAYRGANLRGVFMKIEGVFIVEVPKGDGKLKKEGRICGTLYELAELDWEETEPELKEQYELEKQQRQAYFKRRNGNADAMSVFQASVNESLLPSTGTKRSREDAPPPQSSPPNYFLMPQAPKGYRFRPILKEGYEAILNLSLVSGRYYPRLLSHPALAGTITRALTAGRRDGTLKQANNLFSLEGLCAGHFNAVDPTIYKKSRVQMVEDADVVSMEEVEKFKAAKEQERMMDSQMAGEEETMDEDMNDELLSDSMNVD